MYTKHSILAHFDSQNPEREKFYPAATEDSTFYHFWLDLEHGYCKTAGSRIHLYANNEKWAVVTEKSGYFNRGLYAGIELNYFGTCIDYVVRESPYGTNMSNTVDIELISGDELDRICNEGGDGEMDGFEMVSPDAAYVIIRGKEIAIEQDISKYRNLGIHSRAEYTSPHLISFEDLLRYYNDTMPEVIQATESEIKQHLIGDIPRLMTIDHFHYSTVYQDNHNPAGEELYQLIADILITKDVYCWKPTLPVNNHWSCWESGSL